MKILLVEDDQNKREKLSHFVRETSPSAELTSALSYRGAVEKLRTEPWDFLILDMTLPTFDVSEHEDGFQTEAFGGWNVLREMKRKGVSVPTVVVTGFETLGEGNEKLNLAQLRERLSAEYPGTYVSTVFYSPGESAWMPALAEILKRYDTNPDRR